MHSNKLILRLLIYSIAMVVCLSEGSLALANEEVYQFSFKKKTEQNIRNAKTKKPRLKSPQKPTDQAELKAKSKLETNSENSAETTEETKGETAGSEPIQQLDKEKAQGQIHGLIDSPLPAPATAPKQSNEEVPPLGKDLSQDQALGLNPQISSGPEQRIIFDRNLSVSFGIVKWADVAKVNTYPSFSLFWRPQNFFKKIEFGVLILKPQEAIDSAIGFSYVFQTKLIQRGLDFQIGAGFMSADGVIATTYGSHVRATLSEKTALRTTFSLQENSRYGFLGLFFEYTP